MNFIEAAKIYDIIGRTNENDKTLAAGVYPYTIEYVDLSERETGYWSIINTVSFIIRLDGKDDSIYIKYEIDLTPDHADTICDIFESCGVKKAGQQCISFWYQLVGRSGMVLIDEKLCVEKFLVIQKGGD